MARLWGRDWSRGELERRVGDIQQIGGVRLVELADGKERGVRAAQFRTGTGFAFTVLLDRALDISSAEYCGRSLNWRSMTEDVHPAYFEPDGLNWVRTFYGGLVVTCGLTWAGAPCSEPVGIGTNRLGPRDLGLHGRISHTPAKNVWADGEWEGDDYRMWVRGRCQESMVFAENLILHREISTRIGANSFELVDTVENAGFDRTEHQLLYHVNIGFPAVDGDSELLSPSSEIIPRDADAAAGLDQARRLDDPVHAYDEKAYFHTLSGAGDGATGTAIVNRKLGFGVFLKFNLNELPYYTQWKMMGERSYVVGMEPANCLPVGRAAEREAGRLQFLEGRETRRYRLEIGALTSHAEIDEFERSVAAWSAG